MQIKEELFGPVMYVMKFQVIISSYLILITALSQKCIMDQTIRLKAGSNIMCTGHIKYSKTFAGESLGQPDTLKSPPAENKTMKKATLLSIAVTATFYLLCGCMGYTAFGDDAPTNLLTGFGFYNPYWLIDIANLAIVVHLVGAYQVYCQPLFAFVEKWSAQRWPKSEFIIHEYEVVIPFTGCVYKLNLFYMSMRWRTAFVIVTTVISMLLSFFNDIVGILGAFGF